MEADFRANMDKLGIGPDSGRLLLAISGGADSVVLAHLLKKCGYDFELAHCNFQLRGEESAADEAFCGTLSRQLHVALHTKKFDVVSYGKEKGISIQMAARDLRYNWFGELMNDVPARWLLTAHHGSDVAETMILNLVRGTGIKGMKGMSAIKGHIVRPLYSFTKSEILDYAHRNGIEFRHDASNDEHKYDRNFVRLQVLPLLKEINENVERTLMRNSRHFEQEGAIVEGYISRRREKIVISGTEAEVRLDKKSLQEEPYLETVLHGILEEYGFSDTQEQNIIRNLRAEAQAGKLFESPGYTLTVDRQAIIIRPKAGGENAAMSIHDLKDLENVPGFRVLLGQRFALPSKNDLYLKASDLVFPLELRKRAEGDKFRPYGMKGFKLVSDFFKDEKLNWFEKNECLLLVNGNSDIIWVTGHRSDDRYKVDEQDVDLIRITFEQ